MRPGAACLPRLSYSICRISRLYLDHAGRTMAAGGASHSRIEEIVNTLRTAVILGSVVAALAAEPASAQTPAQPQAAASPPALPLVPAAPGTQPAPPNRWTPAQIQQAFDMADADSDGGLTRAEAQRVAVMPHSFEDMDQNKDGLLSRQEFQAGFTR